jgi:sterol desaturase/sphingolipid hydroxylase (fatty acid hydroxylase superfamily)
MKNFKVDNKGSGQLFQNKFLERLTRTPFIVPVLFYYLVALLCIWHAYTNPSISLLNNAWMIPAGMITFSFVEYLIHRFLFHFHASTKKQEQLQYSIHGIHHEFPRDKDRLVMPMVISVLLAFLFYLLFDAVIGKNGLVFFAGFIAGYSTYLVIHFAVHAMKPPQNFLKYWWRHHSLHHYASVHSAFSVSFPLWDLLFGTMPSEKEQMNVSGKLPDAV